VFNALENTNKSQIVECSCNPWFMPDPEVLTFEGVFSGQKIKPILMVFCNPGWIYLTLSRGG
jgi:hypothetical protein